MLKTNVGKIPLAVFSQVVAMQEKHNLQAVDKRIRPTLEMLAEIGLLLGRNTTNSQAWQLWHLCLAIEDNARNNDTMRAEVAFWYGVDTCQMADLDVIKLHSNLHRVKAQKRIHDGSFDPCDYKTVYSLFLLAYGDEDRALKARAQSIEAYMEHHR